MSQANADQAREKAIQAVANYKDLLLAKFTETVDEQVYELLGGADFEEKIFQYRRVIFLLFEQLTKPEINQALDSELDLETLSGMLYRMHQFLSVMDDKRFRTYFKYHELSDYGNANSKTIEQWNDIAAKYDLELQLELVRRGIAKVVPK